MSKRVMWAGVLPGIVAITGELLGWRNDVGAMMLTAATVLGAIGGLTALTIGSSSEEIRTIHAAVQDNGATLRSVDHRLGSVDGKLDKLDAIDEDLDKLDAIDGDLDKVQIQLDTQPGVLDTQVELLTQIRDRS